MRIIRILSLVFFAFGSNSIGTAEVIFSSYEDNFQTFCCGGLLFGGALPSDPGPIEVAASFTSPATFRFTSATLAIDQFRFGGYGPNVADVFLLSDNQGQPGAVLEHFHLVGAMAEGDLLTIHAVNVASIVNPVLQAQSTYWVSVTAPKATHGVWYGTVYDFPEMSIATRGYVPDEEWVAFISRASMAFLVEGDRVSNVPEPATGSLFFSGLVIAGASFWQRRRTQQRSSMKQLSSSYFARGSESIAAVAVSASSLNARLTESLSGNIFARSASISTRFVPAVERR